MQPIINETPVTALGHSSRPKSCLREHAHCSLPAIRSNPWYRHARLLSLSSRPRLIPTKRRRRTAALLSFCHPDRGGPAFSCVRKPERAFSLSVIPTETARLCLAFANANAGPRSGGISATLKPSTPLDVTKPKASTPYSGLTRATPKKPR